MKKIIIFILILTFIFGLAGCSFRETSSGFDSVSNAKLCWGLKRNPHATPNINPGEDAVLKKYDGIYLGDTSSKTVYLTFDEGYENGYTGKILDILKKHKVPACFFVTGPYLEKETELINRMVKEGHLVGNHTVNHPSMPSLSDSEVEEELISLDRIFYETTGKSMKFLRPPMGEHSERTMAISKSLGYKTVFWSIAYEDWNVKAQPSGDFVFNSVMDNLHNGAIILMHAVSSANAETLERIILEAKSRGYTFKPLSSIN